MSAASADATAFGREGSESEVDAMCWTVDAGKRDGGGTEGGAEGEAEGGAIITFCGLCSRR